MSVVDFILICLIVLYGLIIIVLALLIMNQDRVIMEMEELYENLLDNLAKCVKGEGNEIDDGLENDSVDDTDMDICRSGNGS